MLAMRDEEILVFTVIIAVAVVAAIAVRHWATLRSQKLRLLEEALRNDRVDEQIKRELVRAFAANEVNWVDLVSRWGRRIVFAAGWLLMFGGVGTLLFGSRYDQEVGGILAFVGFAVLALPMALRELETRKRTARP